MSRTFKATIPAVLLLTAVSVAAPFAGTDYTSLPAVASDVEKQIKDSKVSLSQAIDIAQKDTNGVASSASMNLGNPASIEVNTYGEGKHFVVAIDPASGLVKSKTEVARFPGAPAAGEMKTTPSGLMYFDMVEGTGAQPSGPAAQVTVHYTGWLTDGTKFDSSVDRGQPATFPLGGVIRGWTEGVGSMKVGGKRKLLIPSSLAYGDQGRPSIPGKATLIFDVELLNVIEPGKPDPGADPVKQPTDK